MWFYRTCRKAYSFPIFYWRLTELLSLKYNNKHRRKCSLVWNISTFTLPSTFFCVTNIAQHLSGQLVVQTAPILIQNKNHSQFINTYLWDALISHLSVKVSMQKKGVRRGRREGLSIWSTGKISVMKQVNEMEMSWKTEKDKENEKFR